MSNTKDNSKEDDVYINFADWQLRKNTNKESCVFYVNSNIINANKSKDKLEHTDDNAINIANPEVHKYETATKIKKMLLECNDHINRKSIKSSLRIIGFFMMLKKESPAKKIDTVFSVLARLFGINKKIGRDEYNPYFLISKLLSDSLKQLDELIEDTALPEEYIKSVDKVGMQVISKVNNEKARGRVIVCVMAPIFNDNNLNDGYYKRVKVIDGLMGDNTLRIYMSFDYSIKDVIVNHIDDNHINIIYNSNKNIHNQIIYLIAKKTNLVYHHSIIYSNGLITKDRNITKIYDFHGAVPEEQEMYGKINQAQIESVNEQQAIEYGDVFISVTRAMQKHILNKYPNHLLQFINLPIFDDCTINTKDISTRPYINNKPVIVYAGGVQKWQMIEKMQEAIDKKIEDCIFKIFVPNPDEFWSMWNKDKFINENLLVDSRTSEALKEEYKKCHYGFILREDCVVNNVACPTKLIEYLAHGIVPIMYTLNVGDFNEDGMQYITYDDFINYNLPSEKERQTIATNNHRVFNTMLKRYEEGKNQLIRTIVNVNK